MSDPALHDDEIPLEPSVVRGLVDAFISEAGSLPLVRLPASGSSNTLYRLGEDLLVRLPRQPGGSESILKEARWLPHVAPALGIEVPAVVAVGQPGLGYPENWSVVRWLPGRTAPVATGGADLATDLARVVTGLRGTEVPAGALADPALRWYRGGPFVDLAETIDEALEGCRSLEGLDLDLDLAETTLHRALADPRSHLVPAPRWYHGDLVAENLLVDDRGRLSAVLDFGGLAVGDPAVDLSVAWELLTPAARTVFRIAVDVADDEWLVGRAWALAIALNTFPYYWHTMPGRCQDRLAARAVLDDVRGRPGDGTAGGLRASPSA